MHQCYRGSNVNYLYNFNIIMKALKRDSKDLNLKMEVEEKMGYNLLNYTRIRRNIFFQRIENGKRKDII